MEMVKFDVDVAFEDERFSELLERLGKEVPSAFVRIVELEGPGGGWPLIEVIIPKADVRKFAEWYCEDDAVMWEEEFLESAETFAG